MSGDRPFEGALARYVEATEPPQEVVDRLGARADAAMGAAGSVRQDLPAPTDPTAAAQARVLGRVARSRRALETPWRPSFVGGARPRNPWQAPAFAAAALACVAVGLVWWLQAQVVDDEVPALVLAPATPDALPETELSATDAQQILAPLPGLELTMLGQGALSGTEAAPVVTWRRGRLDVEVDPDEHIGLVVQTEEGEVRVVGTGFSVDRDLLGTHVDVHHGRVIVVCRSADELSLGEGEKTTCLPVTAAGLLGRARLLSQGGASAKQILDAADAGLRVSPRPDGIWGELVYLRMSTLQRAERFDEARAAATQYIDSGQLPRRAEALRLADGGTR